MTRNKNYWTLFQYPALMWEMVGIEPDLIYESPIQEEFRGGGH